MNRKFVWLAALVAAIVVADLTVTSQAEAQLLRGRFGRRNCCTPCNTVCNTTPCCETAVVCEPTPVCETAPSCCETASAACCQTACCTGPVRRMISQISPVSFTSGCCATASDCCQPATSCCETAPATCCQTACCQGPVRRMVSQIGSVRLAGRCCPSGCGCGQVSTVSYEGGCQACGASDGLGCPSGGCGDGTVVYEDAPAEIMTEESSKVEAPEAPAEEALTEDREA